MILLLAFFRSVYRQEFDVISDDAKDFISRLLVRDPLRRLTASRALKHRWLSSAGGGGAAEAASLANNKANLRRFLARRRWQRCGQAIRYKEKSF